MVLLNDVYCSYSYEEVKPLVAPEVAARLDHEQRYGIFWHNTKRNMYKHVTESRLNGKTYHKKRKVTPKPREEWIAVPVPSSGTPQDWVDTARETIRETIDLLPVGGSGSYRAGYCV